MTDTEIIDLFFERSEQAITELAKKHGAAVGRIAYNILGNWQDAEECVNDTWLGTWNAIPPHRPSPLKSFVCRIARNLATKRYHANTAEKRCSQYDVALDELAECIPDSGDVEDAYGAKELAAAIDAFLDTLDSVDKFVFMRRYWYADTLEDIAKASGLSYGTVSVRLHRVRNKLKKQLMKEALLV